MLIQKNNELLLNLFREKTEYHIWEDSILNKWNNWKMQQYIFHQEFFTGIEVIMDLQQEENEYYKF